MGTTTKNEQLQAIHAQWPVAVEKIRVALAAGDQDAERAARKELQELDAQLIDLLDS